MKKLLLTSLFLMSFAVLFFPLIVISCEDIQDEKSVNNHVVGSDTNKPDDNNNDSSKSDTENDKGESKDGLNEIDNKTENNKKPAVEANTKIKTQISASSVGWDGLTVYEFNAKYEKNKILFKKFVLDNLDKFIEGSKKLITSINDFDIEFVKKDQVNPVSVELKLTIEPNHWYLDNGIENKKKSNNIIISGFRQIDKQLNNSGGTIDGHVNVSAYKGVIDLFNLKYKTNLSTLTNQYFLDTLKKLPDYKNLNIKLKEGNDKEGMLVLELSGKYKQEIISATDITINNFYAFNPSYKMFSLSNVKINHHNWFNDLKPINTSNDDEKQKISQISSNDWVQKYLDDFYLVDENKNIICHKKDVSNLGWDINLQASFNKNDIDFSHNTNSSISFSHKIYDKNSGKWVDLEKKIIKIQPLTSSANFLNENDAKQYLVNETISVDSKFKDYYPSYFLGIRRFGKYNNQEFWNTNDFFLNEKLELIKNKYFVNKQISLTYDLDSIYADDFQNTLDINLILVLDGTKQQQFNKSFKLVNKTKKLSENKKIKEQQKNVLVVEPSSIQESKIVSYLKKNKKEEVENVFDNKQEKLVFSDISKDQIVSSVINASLFSYEDTFDNLNFKLKQIEKQISLGIFGDNFQIQESNSFDFSSGSNEFSFSSGLYWQSKTEIFYIEYIQYEFQNNIDIVLTRVHDSLISVEVNFKTKIGFSGNIERNYDSVLRMSLLKSAWKNKK